MKQKVKERFRRITAIFMAIITVLSIYPSALVNAETSEKAYISFQYCYDASGNFIRWSDNAIFDGLYAGVLGEARVRIYANDEIAFCLQPTAPLHTGDYLTKNASNAWNTLSADQQEAIRMIMFYGLQGNENGLSGTQDEKWIATQMMIWEITTGCRNATGSYDVKDFRCG